MGLVLKRYCVKIKQIALDTHTANEKSLSENRPEQLHASEDNAS